MRQLTRLYTVGNKSMAEKCTDWKTEALGEKKLLSHFVHDKTHKV